MTDLEDEPGPVDVQHHEHQQQGVEDGVVGLRVDVVECCVVQGLCEGAAGQEGGNNNHNNVLACVKLLHLTMHNVC